jgi:hypothetical protein
MNIAIHKQVSSKSTSLPEDLYQAPKLKTEEPFFAPSFDMGWFHAPFFTVMA